jgi:hypothetical protein
MYGIIFSAIFCFFAGLALLTGALKGRKYKWQYSLSRLIVVIISVVASAILASMISNAIIGTVVVMLIDSGLLRNVAGIDVGGMVNSLPSGVATVKALGSMIVSPLLFIPIFILIKAILNLFVKLISLAICSITSKGESEKREGKKYVERKHYRKKHEKLIAHYPNFFGGLLGALCSVFVLCAFICPLVCSLGVIDSVAPVATATLSENEQYGEVVDIAVDVLDGAANNVGTTAVTLTGGKFFYGMMTTAVVDGEMTNLNKESELFAAVVNAVGSASTEGTESHETAEAIRDISPAFDKSVVARTLISELCTEASEDWKAGNAYCGIKRPSLGKGLAPITDSLINVFATSDKENIKNDVKAITEAVAVLADRGLVSRIVETKNPMVILSDEAATAELLDAFLEDERLDPLVDGVADFGITIMLDKVNTPKTRAQLFEGFVADFTAVSGEDAAALEVAYANVLDDYGIRCAGTTLAADAAAAKLGGSDMSVWFYENIAMNEDAFIGKTTIVSQQMLTEGSISITNRDHEAKALAHAFVIVYGMTDDIAGGSFDAKRMLGTMGPALDSFAQTETIGQEKTKYMLEAILQSQLIHDSIGFGVVEATDSAASIADNSANKSYASVMSSLSGVVEMLEAATDKSKNTKEAVDKMLNDLTPEAASVMETMATPSVMKNYGVPEKSADSVANMVSGTFGNLKDVPAEDYEKESAAVADMMNVMMSITEGDTNAEEGVFGGENSVTQITEEEYVNNIMDSSAMSKTVVDTVYADGDEPKVDPLNSGRKLNDTEKTNLVGALNNKWNESEKDEQTKKELTAIAAMMNIAVDMTENGFELVETDVTPDENPEETPDENPEDSSEENA